jgi:hypothetical protein
LRSIVSLPKLTQHTTTWDSLKRNSGDMSRFAPVSAVNAERLVVMSLEKQGEIRLDEDQVVAVALLDQFANLVAYLLLASSHRSRGSAAERRGQRGELAGPDGEAKRRYSGSG